MNIRHVVTLAAVMVAFVPSATMADQAQPTERQLGTRKVKPAKSKPPAPSTDDNEQAARLAEGRRKFFESKPDDDGARTPGDFGGYDYRRDSGTMRPGAMFKF